MSIEKLPELTAVQGGIISAVIDPVWCVELLVGRPVLNLFHPTHGKLSFLMPPHEALAMSSALAKAAGVEPKS